MFVSRNSQDLPGAENGRQSPSPCASLVAVAVDRFVALAFPLPARASVICGLFAQFSHACPVSVAQAGDRGRPCQARRHEKAVPTERTLAGLSSFSPITLHLFLSYSRMACTRASVYGAAVSDSPFQSHESGNSALHTSFSSKLAKCMSYEIRVVS
jgi:hypothetical protein